MSRALAPITAFIGTTPNIGTTAAAFAAALRIAEASGQSVGFLCMHLKSAKIHRYLGIQEPAVTLGKLRPELRAGSLTQERLRRAVYSLPGLPHMGVLFGNTARDQAEFFTPEEAEHLLAVAEETFSFLVLDVGAYWDNAATVCAMRKASTRVLVTTEALSHFQEDGQRWIGQVSPLFGIGPEQYETLLVHYPWRNGGYQMKHICKELGTSSFGQFHLSSSLFAGLDSGAYDRWLQHEKEGKQAMQEAAARLMEKHRIRTVSPNLAASPWYRKLLSHRNGAQL